MRRGLTLRTNSRRGFIAVEVVLSAVILLCCFIAIGQGMSSTMLARERSIHKYIEEKNMRGAAVEAIVCGGKNP